MTGAILAAKVAGVCTYSGCTQPCSDSAVQCVSHAAAAAARVRRSSTKTRAARRLAGLCAYCGRPSATYGCGACKPKQQQLRLTEVSHGE